MLTISPEQYTAIQNILSVFETGRVRSDAAYSTVAVLADGAGFSYGIHQSTDRSDTLDAVLLRYADLGGARAAEARDLLARLAADESTTLEPGRESTWPRWARDAVTFLRELGADGVMRRAQDAVFEELYWAPAESQARAMGLGLALSYLVVYDTCVQSGPGGVARIRRMFGPLPPASGGDEREWTQAYVRARRSWLASYPNPVVQRTVYRMDAVQALIDAGNWDLRSPLVVRGQTIR